MSLIIPSMSATPGASRAKIWALGSTGNTGVSERAGKNANKGGETRSKKGGGE